MEEVSLKGHFTHCLFKAEAYAVWNFIDNDEGRITLTGPLGHVTIDQEYTVFGHFVDHPRYGIQFKVSTLKKELPQSANGIVAYLSSANFKGIGKVTAQKIYDALGDEALTKIKDDPTILDELDLSKKQKEVLHEVLSQNIGFEDTFYSLITDGVSVSDINKIVALYKEDTKAILKEEPYRPYFDIYGISFRKCDAIALKNGIAIDDVRREAALIHDVIKSLTFKSGDSYTDISSIEKELKVRQEICDVMSAIDNAISERSIVKEDERYYTKESYEDEFFIARYLFSINEETKCDIQEAIDDMNHIQGFSFDSDQKKAIENFFDHRFSIITGGPGTGKTTIIKGIIDIIRKIDPLSNIHIVAPTGRAAKRIRELCDVDSSTIHSLLKWDKETNTFTHDASLPLDIDYLIIDEFSMVDTWLFRSLLSALISVKHLCVIGDEDQLPSVAPGDILHDLIDADIFPLKRLKKIHRQRDGSGIVELSQDVKEGLIRDDYGNEVIFIDEDEVIIKEKMIEMIKDLIDDGYDLNDIQVLSPMYKGDLGIDVLNMLMQEIFNPSVGELEYKNNYHIYRVDDKIIQLKNQRDDDVFNGDIGKIVEIDKGKDGYTILARFDDIYIDYYKETLANIALAYCISVHKAQGSEYPVVFFAFSKNHLHMLNRRLIYTALSRSSDRLVILGDMQTLKKGLKKKMPRRKTTLIKRLYDLMDDAL